MSSGTGSASVPGSQSSTNPAEKVRQNYTSGATHVIDGATAFGPIYTDGTYNYYGDAAPGSALTAAVWRVSRMSIATSRVEWADGNGNFDNVFTDLATVAALTFS